MYKRGKLRALPGRRLRQCTRCRYVAFARLTCADGPRPTVSRGRLSSLRRALGNIAGIAALVGQVGAPAIEAVRSVLSALGIS